MAFLFLPLFQIGQMRSLSELLLDGLALSYPDAKVCRDGTEAIMKFLCKGRKAARPSNQLQNRFPFNCFWCCIMKCKFIICRLRESSTSALPLI